MGRVETANGWIYMIGQWYPRMCIRQRARMEYQSLSGCREFYLEYGNYDFTITTSPNQLVALLPASW
jgi:hypothetical protein